MSEFYDIKYRVVLAYLPEKKHEYDTYTNAIYPEGIETVPKRFAISWRNKWMMKQANTVITYVIHPSAGACEFEQLAVKQGKRVIKLAKK